MQQRAVEELEGRKSKENSEIQAQIDKYVTEQRAKIQSNNDEISREKERFTGWRLKKQQEEKKISDAVGYFVSRKPDNNRGRECVQPRRHTKASRRVREAGGILCGNV